MRGMEADIVISRDILEMLNHFLEEGGQSEYDTYSFTAKFPATDMEMDVKCCGTSEEGEPSWTEAVLFRQGV